MNMLEHMNEALAYVEAHLAEEIDLQEAARLALCSEYHFTRMFSFLAGMTMSEYVRRRRLTLAAFDLQQSQIRIIDVAVKYGYQSPDAFTKAFQHYHGITPTEARSHGRALKVCSRMTFQLTIRGGENMEYRMEEKNAFRIVGLHKRVAIQFEGVNPAIAEMWQSLNTQMIAELKQLSNTAPAGMISASINFSNGRMEEQGELDHYIGVATTETSPPHYAQLEVAPATWAVFEAVGPFPGTLQHIWGRIYSEWFPSSKYEAVPGPEMLWNEHKDTSSPAFRSEIWIPVRKKSIV